MLTYMMTDNISQLWINGASHQKGLSRSQTVPLWDLQNQQVKTSLFTN